MLFFGGNGILNPFMPVYLDEIGFSRTIIGTILALGPLVAMISQLIWGLAGDRARTKNTILKILLSGCAALIILFPLSTSLWYVFTIFALFTFFQSSIMPTIDTITLEHLENTTWKFGPIRMAGTIGFAFVTVVTGMIMRNNTNYMFIIYFLILLVNLALVFKLPDIKGHQFGGVKVSPQELFKNKKLVMLMGFSFAIQITLGFYYGFFPVYFKELGGDSTLLGWAMFIAALSEVPFLLFADKVINKIGIVMTLIGSAIATSIRWLILFLIKDVYQAFPVNAMHGLTFIIFTYCLATYINKNVPKELRASGQALNGIISMGLARIIGNVFGGYLSDIVGIKHMFLYVSLFGFISVLIFGIMLIKHENNTMKTEYEGE